MKTRTAIYMFSGLCLMAFAACSREEIKDSAALEPVSGSSGTVSLRAGIDDALPTRTSLQDADGQRYIRWSQDDEIGIVYSSGITRGTVDNTTIEDNSAYFTFSQGEGSILYGFYPYQGQASVSGSILSLEIPSRQKYTEGSVFAPGTCLMAGKLAGDALSFSNVCSIVEFKLTGNETITWASLRSASSVLSGAGSIDMEADTPVFDPSEGGRHYVDLDLGEGIQLTSVPVSLYFVVPSGTYTDLELVTDGGKGSCRIKSSQTHQLQRNHILPFKSAAVSRSVEGKNLAEAGPSNCYLLSPEETGTFTFPAKKISGTVLKGTIADVLWQSGEGLVQNVLYDADKDLISFEKPAPGAGNALICLFDKNHRVVWSFHIWISVTNDQTWGRELDSSTLTTMAADFSTTYHTFLDRNVGATFHPADKGIVRSTLSASSAYYVDGESLGAAVAAMTAQEAADACGFLYQYGRPVPLPSRSASSWGASGYEGEGEDLEKAFSEYTRETAFSKYYEGYEGWELTNLNIGKDEMAAYPNAFNKITAGSANYQSYQASWANDIHVTGESAEWAVSKTDNDPCPAGYRVPTKRELYNFKVDGAKYPWVRRSDWSGLYAPESGETLGWYYFLRYYHPSPNYGAYALTYRATAVPGSITEFLYIPIAGWRPAGGSNPRNNKYTGGLNVNNARLWCFDPEDRFTSADDCSFKAYQSRKSASYKTSDTNATVTVASVIDPSLKPHLSQNTDKEIYGEGDMFAQYLDISTGRQINEQQSSSALCLAQSAAAFSVRCVKE